jgi:hypothetical protein
LSRFLQRSLLIKAKAPAPSRRGFLFDRSGKMVSTRAKPKELSVKKAATQTVLKGDT